MQLTELVEAIDFLRKAGWKIEPPAKHRTVASLISEPRRIGRPPKTSAVGGAAPAKAKGEWRFQPSRSDNRARCPGRKFIGRGFSLAALAVGPIGF